MKKLEKQEAKLRVRFVIIYSISTQLNEINRPKLRNALEEIFTKVLNCLTSTRSRYECDGTPCDEQRD